MAATETAEKPKARRTATRAAKSAEPKSNAGHAKSDRKADEGFLGNGTGALLAAGAAGAALGVAAMIGRKVAVQAPTALAGDWDKALAAEHAVVIKVFDALEMTTRKNTTKRAMLLAQLKHALAKHALQEENVVYPALRDAGQAEAADHLNHDHGYVKQYLYELTNCPKDSERFLEIVRRFRADLEKHVHEEEDTLFPSLKARLSAEQNKTITLAMNKEGFKLA